MSPRLTGGLVGAGHGLAVGIGAAVTLLHLSVAGRYGLHRDEAYFVECGRHLAAGYVDQPPVVPIIARVSAAIGGVTPFALRVAPALAAGATVVVVAAITRRLGGGRWAVLLAGLSAAACPVLLGAASLLNTVVFDQLWWAAAALVVIVLLSTVVTPGCGWRSGQSLALVSRPRTPWSCGPSPWRSELC